MAWAEKGGRKGGTGNEIEDMVKANQEKGE